MSMAPVAAAISGNSSGATKSKIHSIAWPGPAMKPSSDIALFTTTLPFPVLVSLILLLTATAYADTVTTGGTGYRSGAKPGPTALLLPLSKSSTLDRHVALPALGVVDHLINFPELR